MIADRLAPIRARAEGYWADRSPRERLLLRVLGGIAAVVLLMVLIVRPLQAARADAIADIRTYETLTARLRAAGSDAGRPGVARTGPATSVVTTSAAEFGVTVQRLEPDGERLRVGLADAPFDGTMRWLADLERTSTLRIAEVRLDRRPAPGTVSAEILLDTQ